MGRVKLEIKKIENTTNRQVTFSKRRNGLIKKAYEISVLCDVDVALILFSPSGRVTTFSGNRSIEEVMARYMNLPEHERGRLHNQEEQHTENNFHYVELSKSQSNLQVHNMLRSTKDCYLQRALGKLKGETNPTNQAEASPACVAQLEEIQQEIFRCKSEVEDMEKRLRIFEGDPYAITTLCEAEYREKILEETLKHVRLHKQVLEEEYNSAKAPSTSQVQMPQESLNINGLSTTNTHILDWVPQRDPQVQILNFLGSNGLLPIRDEGEPMENMLSQSLNMSSCGLNMNMQVNEPPSSTSGMHHHHEVAAAAAAAADNSNSKERPQFGQAIDVNLSPWTTQFYPTGSEPFPSSQPRERGLLELFYPQFTP